MVRPYRRFSIACGVLAGTIAAGAAAENQQVYRYVDPAGRVIYSDTVPPADAKNVEAKRLNPNLIETDQVSMATQRAQDQFPVTLYTFACGDVCDRAEALLNRRGVPHTTIDVEKDPKGAEKMKKLTGDMQAPVLQAGDKLLVRGFSESQWQALLDTAGYPKTPSPRRASLPPGTSKGAAATPPAPPAPAPFSQPAAGGYPKD